MMNMRPSPAHRPVWGWLLPILVAALLSAAARPAAAEESCDAEAKKACKQPAQCKFEAKTTCQALRHIAADANAKPGQRTRAAQAIDNIKAFFDDNCNPRPEIDKKPEEVTKAHVAGCTEKRAVDASANDAGVTVPAAPVPPAAPDVPSTPAGEVCKAAGGDAAACGQALADAAKQAGDAVRAEAKAHEGQIQALHGKDPGFDVPFDRARRAVEAANEAATALEEAVPADAPPADIDRIKGQFDAALATLDERRAEARALVGVAAQHAAEVAALCRKSCLATSRAFCIEAETGLPFCRGDKQAEFDLPESLGVNTTLVLRVMGPEGTDGDIEIATNFIRSLDRLTDERPAAAPDGPRAGLAPPAPAPPKYVQLKEIETKIPDESGLLELRIAFRFTPEDAGRPVKAEYTVDIDHGKYFLEIGVLAPFTVYGSRTVTATPVPGTGGERRLTVREDHDVVPALAINVFPGGRRLGRISSFDPCRFWDLVGFQAAVNLDLPRAFDRIHLGIVLEPITGVSLSSGVAVVKGQYLPDGYAANMLVPKDEAWTPRTLYAPRWYVGATVTTDVLTTILNTRQRLQASGSSGD